MEMSQLTADRAGFQRTLIGALALPLLLMALLAGVFVWQVRSLLSAVRWVDHTDQVIAQANLTQGLLVDMETGVRGYLITGSPHFLEPYTGARGQIDAALDGLRRLVADNPSQTGRVGEMLPVVARWQRYALQVMTLRDQHGDYQAFVATETGKRLMDDLRARIRGFLHAEETLRDARRRTAEATTARVYGVGGVLTLLLGAVLAFFSRQQLTGLAASYGGALQLARDRAEALRQSEEQFSTTLQSIGDAVIATDAQGRVTFMNSIAQSLTGWTDGEAAGKELKEVFRIINEQTRQAVESPVDRVMQTGMIVGLANHTLLIARDGTEVPLDDSGAPIRDAQGSITGVVLVFRDISERKVLERELHDRMEALAEADRRKDEFLAMLAHELRNPLGAVNNALQILRVGDVSRPAWQRAMGVADRQVKHQARLVDDLLDVSRITQGKITLHPERVDLVQVVRDAAHDSHNAMEDAGLTLTLALPPGPVWVEGDATRLAQVLANLLQNTLKFTDRGGHVTVQVTADPGAGLAVTAVRDTGIGIEPEMVPRVFETFSQADRTLHRSPGGLGLGLALVKGLIELHGGRVSAHSEGLGRGAEFTFSLPLALQMAAGPARPPRAAPEIDPPNLRILVVDDNHDAALSLRDLLELQSYRVEVTHSGPTGVAAARQFHPNVVLCDIGLPGMDGYAVAGALRQDPATASVRLIAVSGYGQEEDLRRSQEAGFDAHFTKPLDLDALQRLLKAPPEKR
jgi:PAS domain S-box-containing protein